MRKLTRLVQPNGVIQAIEEGSDLLADVSTHKGHFHLSGGQNGLEEKDKRVGGWCKYHASVKITKR